MAGPEFMCQKCESVFTDPTAPQRPGPPRKYCDACSSRTNVYRRRWGRQARAEKRIEVACTFCRAVILSSGVGARNKAGATGRAFCSRKCSDGDAVARRHAALVATKEPRVCVNCAGEIDTEQRRNKVYCSRECKINARNALRRHARAGGEVEFPVSREYIFHRDRGRCHVCRRRVALKSMHLGHLIPVAPYRPGDPVGSYAPSNIRAECARCNMGKGNRPANEQLMVVG